METTIDSDIDQSSDVSTGLRSSMAAMRLSFAWFGTRKTLTSQQKAKAADAFDAEGKYLSAAKRLIDTSDPTFREVTSIKTQATAYFKGVSLPYPEPGIRLIRRADIDGINEKLGTFVAELGAAVGELDSHLDELKHEARDRLGSLYNEADYPPSVVGLFEIGWEFPSVEPPSYLRELNPRLYEAECKRVATRFDEAVAMAEAAFIEELNKLVEHLADRLSGSDGGEPKVFRDSVIDNFRDFFDRFQHLNVRSNEQLDEVVQRAEAVLSNVRPQSLRDSGSLRAQVAGGLSSVQASLDGLMVDRPRRNIQRRGR
jgi:hypothetical protein